MFTCAARKHGLLQCFHVFSSYHGFGFEDLKLQDACVEGSHRLGRGQDQPEHFGRLSC